VRRSVQLAVFLAIPALAWADGPSDLQASLLRLHGDTPVKVRLNYSGRQEATAFFEPVVSQGALQIHLAEDASGLHVDWPSQHPQTTGEEVRNTDREARGLGLPLQNAVQDLDAAHLDQLLNQAEALSRTLERARFKQETPELYLGKPARLLVYSFEPAIRPDHRSHVSYAEGTLRIWVGEDGRPLAAESQQDYQGRQNRLCRRFHVTSLVRTTYAVLGQRLVVASRTSESTSNDTGDRFQNQTSWTLSRLE
jgi:hypothetical protein